MADWQDGAEYAPAERPDGFATPRTAALSAAPPVPHPAEGLPLQAPDAFQPSPLPTPPLSALVPSSGPSRDPRQAFDSGMTITEGSAWGSAHSGPGGAVQVRDPKQPIITSSSFGSVTGGHGAGGHGSGAAPVPVSQFAPPTGAPVNWGPPGSSPVQQGPSPLAWNQPPAGAAWSGHGPAPQVQNDAFMAKVKALGYALVICLVAGLFISPLSFVLLIAAIPLSLMASVKKQTLMRVAAVAAASVLLLGMLVPGDNDAIDAIFAYSRWACLVVLVIDALVVWKAFEKGRN